MDELFVSNTDSLRPFLATLAFYLPRSLVFIFFFPLFSKGAQSALIKAAVAAVIVLQPVNAVTGTLGRVPDIASFTLITVLSELLLGCLLGLTMAIPYYAFKAFGAFVDVYRGATFAAQTSGTDTGSEELPLEQLFSLVFAVLLFAGPGLHAVTSHLLRSYLILPPGTVEVLAFKEWGMTLLGLIGEHVVFAFILSGPILLVVLMVELLMEILSAFTQQMQVYSLQFGMRSVVGVGALMLVLNFAEEEIFQLLNYHSDTLSKILGEIK